MAIANKSPATAKKPCSKCCIPRKTPMMNEKANEPGNANAKSIKKSVMESELTQKYAVAETGRALNKISDDLARSFGRLLKTTLMNKSVKATENNRWKAKNCHLPVAPISHAKKGPNQLQKR